MPLLKHTLPVFVFFSLCGFYFIVVQMQLSHAPDRFLEVHKASLVPLSLTNDKLPLVDKILTPLVSFFVAAFGNPESKAYPTVVDFVWSFGAAIQLPLLEAQREGSSSGPTVYSRLAQKALAYPMVWGILYQRLSGGWILPLWLLAFMHAGTRVSGTGIDAAKAESVLFGWWAGHTLPALAMLIPGQPALSSAPIWIAFPILMSVAQAAYLFVRTRVPMFKSGSSSSSYRVTRARGYVCAQLLYLSALVGSAAAHLHLVLIPGLSSASFQSPFSSPKLGLVNKLLGLAHHLYVFFTPANGLRTPSPASTTADSGVVHFVQFDVLIVFAAVWTAIIWDLALRRRDAASSSTTTTTSTGFRSTLVWVLQLVSLLFVGSMVVGFGGATAGLLMYREAKMKMARLSSAVLTATRPKSMAMVQSEESALLSPTTYGSVGSSNQ